MKLKIITQVEAPLEKVKAGFNQQLFQSLNPPFPPVKLIQFDGSRTGDQVVIQLNFILFKQLWVSKITDDGDGDGYWYFVDVGEKLPFFLKTWTHRHRVEANPQGTAIIDDIDFATPTLLTTWLMYPVLYLQFAYRKPIYRKFFKA